MSQIPKALILLPTASLNDASLAYGVIEIGDLRGVNFFNALRAHLRHASDIAKISATEVYEMQGQRYGTPLYKFLSGWSSWCEFLPRLPEGSFEEDFHGVEDMETLLRLSATDILDPKADVDTLLDDGEEEARPAVIDFKAWHRDLRKGGWFTGSVEELWSKIQDLYIRTDSDELALVLPWRLPVTKHIVDRHGTHVEYGSFEKDIEFFFNHNIKHSDSEKLETKSVKIESFIAAFEDAVRSVP